MIESIRNYYKKHPFKIAIGKNGMKFVPLKSVRDNVYHMSFENSKTGKVIAFNFPVELTCVHDCECYTDGNCYACKGCYLFALNQAIYSENLRYFMNTDSGDFVNAISAEIIRHKSRHLFRWFTCGDIPNIRFLDCMVEIAKKCKDVKFWAYTKKYMIVNQWIAKNGNLPSNLTIIFSHWMNKDGSYYPMINPYNLPTSEFIPFGKEELLETVTYVCPCSNPMVHEHCANCSHPCYDLKSGESMALVEHSTERTKKRDRAIKAIRDIVVDFDLIRFLKSFI